MEVSSGMSFSDSLLKTMFPSSSFSGDFALTTRVSTWNLWLFFIWPRESQLFFPSTALPVELSVQWSHSPNHPQWEHLPLLILFLSSRMSLSTTSLCSNTTYLWIPSFSVFYPMSSCSYSACVLYLTLYQKLPFYCYLTFLVFISESILIISKHLLDTYCVPGNNECCGYINMNKILFWFPIQLKEIKYKVY